MDMKEAEEWYGWKDVRIPSSLVGDCVTKGTGRWEKDYTYIKIPQGFGYDGYCFLLSSACVHLGSDYWWFSICHDMRIELIYDVELREDGKRYKRYKLSGRELYDTVFKEYEVNFKKESDEREAKKQAAKEKHDKSTMGKIVCAMYEGNFYPDDNLKYLRDFSYKAYFIGYNASTYCNHKFDKVRNVKVNFVVFENISKYHFLQYETIINAYLSDFSMYMDMIHSLEKRLNRLQSFRHSSKAVIRSYPEVFVSTGLEDIVNNHISLCKQSIEDIKIRLHDRIEDLLRFG